MLERARQRDALIELIKRGVVAREQRSTAAALAGIEPTPEQWRVFAERSLLLLGVLALATSLCFFIAYNWALLGRLGKFMLVELALAVAVLAALRIGPAQAAGRVSLLAASLLVGVLLGLVGQTYQTGADPWQLFFSWAVLITPWVWVSRSALHGLLWLSLLNLSLILAQAQSAAFLGALVHSQTALVVLLFGLNTAVLWQAEVGLAGHRHAYLWALRLIAIAAGVALTMLAVFALHDPRTAPAWLILWLGWCVVFGRTYYGRDLFMLAGLCLSIIVVLTSVLWRYLLDAADAMGLFVMAILIIAQATAAATWLRQRYKAGVS